MGKQSQIRRIRKRIKTDNGITRKLAQEVSVAGYVMVMNVNSGKVRIK